MNDTEKLVAEALRLRAERTPPPGPVLAALRRPRRDRRPLFLVLATAGTVAAAVVAVTTVTGPPAAEQAPPAVSIPTTAVDPGPAVPTVPLEYSPTWLPDGFTEWQRGTSSHGSERSYQRTGAPDSVASLIGFSVRRDDIATRTASLEASADRVAIHGAPGYFAGGDLHWRVREDRFLVVTTQAVPDARATALRVAESVRPDDRVVRVPVSVDGSTDFTVSALGEEGWTAYVNATQDGHRYLVSLSTSPYLANTVREVTARDRPAQYYEVSGGLLNVDLGGGRYLGVSNSAPTGPLAPPEVLVGIAGRVVVDPRPQVSW